MLDTLFAKFFSAILTVIVPAAQLWDSSKKRLLRARKDEVAVGDLGLPYWFGLKLPSLLTVCGLATIVGLALIALVGGVAVSRITDQKVYPMLHKTHWAVPVTLFENSLLILFAYVLLAVVVYFDIPQYIALGLTSAWRYRPGWISAHRVLTEGGPLNIDLQACRAASNTVFEAMANGSFQYEEDRAAVPQGLQPDELANCLLIACTIESECHDLKKQIKKFAPLYSAVAAIGAGGTRPLSSKAIAAFDNNTFYAHIRSLELPDAAVLPDDQSIHIAVNEVVRLLSAKYKSSALRLAYSWVPICSASLPRVDGKLKAMPSFAGDRRKSMRDLFLKLAVRWQIWPSAAPGPFTYGFNRRIAALLLNLRCITVRREDEALDIDEDVKRLVAETEMQIVDQLKVFIDSGSDKRTTELCKSRFGSAPSGVPMWRLSDEVDYFLFNQARKADGGCFGEAGVKPWHIDGNSFVRKDAP
jgi:hypothetical protein